MAPTTPKPFVFVLMPFSQEFEDVYKLGIGPACKDAGAYCERVDEQIYSGSVLERIYNQIAKADIIVADMTNQNPNVFYETGYAHALGKPTILLTQKVDDIPFDLKHAPHIIYGKSHGKSISSLKPELKKRIKYFIDHPEKKQAVTTRALDYYVNGQKINPPGDNHVNINIVDHDETHGWTLKLAIHNTGTATIDMEDKRFRFVYPVAMGEPERIEQFSQLPGDQYMIVMSNPYPLLPSDWMVKTIRIRNKDIESVRGGTFVPPASGIYNPVELFQSAFSCLFRTVTELGVDEFKFIVWAN